MYTEAKPPQDFHVGKAQTNGSVLVVEDDEAIRDSLSTVLRDEGFVVHDATNGLDAIGFLLNAKVMPSLILLDLIMPQMGGAELLAALEKEKDWKHLPVAMLSATRCNISSPMIVANLAKPIEIEELLGVVQCYAPSTFRSLQGATHSYL